MAFRPLEPQWHIDPTSRHQLRFWDGTAWTDRVADDGVEASDPLPAVSVVAPEFVRPEPSTPKVDHPQAAKATPVDQTPVRRAHAVQPMADEAATDVQPRPSRVAQQLARSSSEAEASDIFNFDNLDGGGYDSGAIAPPEGVDLDRLEEGGGRRLALLGGGLIALVALVAFIGLQVRGSNDDEASDEAEEVASSTVAPDGETATASFPTSAERNVIDRLPGGFSCERAPVDLDGPTDFLARVACEPGEEGSIGLTATGFETRNKSDQYVDELATDANALPASGAAADCSSATEGLWAGGGFTGRVVCLSTPSGATLAWTIGADPVVNVATNGGSADDLLAWWSSSAVPGPVSILEPFPTQTESAALAQLPEELSSACTRFVGEPTTSALASLECRPGDGAEVVYIDSFAADFDVAEYYKAFDLPRIDKGGCRFGVRGNNRFVVDGAEVGRVGCYVNDGRSWVQWYDTRLQMTGQASFVDDDVTQPYDWWAAVVVPGAVEQRTFDRTENRVLASIDQTLASTCVAEPVRKSERYAARLRCVPDQGGILSVTYFGFKTPKKISKEYEERQGDIEQDSGGCSAAGVPSETTWTSDGRSGRQLCQVISGVAEIYSIDVDGKVAVLVVSESGDLDSLAAWLETNR